MSMLVWTKGTCEDEVENRTSLGGEWVEKCGVLEWWRCPLADLLSLIRLNFAGKTVWDPKNCSLSTLAVRFDQQFLLVLWLGCASSCIVHFRTAGWHGSSGVVWQS